MANIDVRNISELDLNGNDLFEDSESFITELNDDNEQQLIIGGLLICTINSLTCGLSDWRSP